MITRHERIAFDQGLHREQGIRLFFDSLEIDRNDVSGEVRVRGYLMHILCPNMEVDLFFRQKKRRGARKCSRATSDQTMETRPAQNPKQNRSKTGLGTQPSKI